MSFDMFPDGAIDYLLNNPPEDLVTDQPADDRIMIEEVPLLLEIEYHNEPEEERILLAPGAQPFILFQMKQEAGAVVCKVGASMIEGEDDLIETLEVFFETMLQERERRRLIAHVVAGEVIPDGSDCQEVPTRD